MVILTVKLFVASPTNGVVQVGYARKIIDFRILAEYLGFSQAHGQCVGQIQ
jgi:hypothetical protein